jgi:hypothetical protein
MTVTVMARYRGPSDGQYQPGSTYYLVADDSVALGLCSLGGARPKTYETLAGFLAEWDRVEVVRPPIQHPAEDPTTGYDC